MTTFGKFGLVLVALGVILIALAALTPDPAHARSAVSPKYVGPVLNVADANPSGPTVGDTIQFTMTWNDMKPVATNIILDCETSPTLPYLMWGAGGSQYPLPLGSDVVLGGSDPLYWWSTSGGYKDITVIDGTWNVETNASGQYVVECHAQARPDSGGTTFAYLNFTALIP